MGGLKNLLPFSYSTSVIGSLALVGFPFLSGFYSKDSILEIAYAKYTFASHFCFYLGTISAFFTAFYSTRLLFLVFLSESNGNKIVIKNAHENGWKITFPLFILSFFSIFSGYLTKDLFIGFGNHYWSSSIFINNSNYIIADYEFLSLTPKLMPLIFTLLGIFLSFFIYSFELENYLSKKKIQSFRIFYTFINRKWYFDRFYNQIFSQKILELSYFFTYQKVDRGFLEFFGPVGIIRSTKNLYNYFKFYYSGNIFHILLLFLFSLILLIFIYLLVYIL